MVSKSLAVSMLILGLTACGYQEGNNGNKTSIHQVGDNRQEYLIKNRTDENDYLDMNTDPHMDTRVTDEKLLGSPQMNQQAENNMKKVIQQKVLQIQGVQSTVVSVNNNQIAIQFRAKDGANAQALKHQITDRIFKLYGSPVKVSEIVQK